MCGIAGFSGPWDRSLLDAMHDSMVHRGPDENGFFFDERAAIGLAFARLSIIDVAGGHQPLTAAEGRIRVIFNGEIYNHEELRADLKQRGYSFGSHSDGEVIGPLYLEYGRDFVRRLRGMFAIALWDAAERRLLLVRDRFGIKPLYFRETPRGTLFASEIKSLLAAGPVEAIDPQALNWYLSFRYVPEDRTMFEGVRKLLPGHLAEVKDGAVRVSRYWSLRDAPQQPPRSEADWADELRERLREAVSVRLMSDVPLGAFLSGGLDSSFIVGLMAPMISEPVETFSFGVGSGWHNESRFAEIAARAFATDHHPLSGRLDDPDLLRSIVLHLDEPLGDTAVIPTYLLSQLTRRHVTVALTGEGADELLGGYDKYKVLTFGDRLAAWMPGGLLRACGDVLARWNRPHRALRFLGSVRDRATAYMELIAVFNEREKRRLLTPDAWRLIEDTEGPEEVIRRILDRGEDGADYFDELMHVDVETWLPNDVLLKADKTSMAHGLEARVPFLDHEFAEFCAGMPREMKLRRGKEKYVLRRAMRPVVPDEIIERKKHGFTVPLDDWRSAGDTGIFAQFLSGERLRRTGWFEPRAVAALASLPRLDEFSRRQLFTVLMGQAWHDGFMR